MFWPSAKIQLFTQKNEILTLIWPQAYVWPSAKIQLFPQKNEILTLIWP